MMQSTWLDMLCFLQVRDFLGKQGRQACKTEIEKAAKIAFLKSYADMRAPEEFDKDAINGILSTGVPCLCLTISAIYKDIHLSVCIQTQNLEFTDSIPLARAGLMP